jgi:hypothetical protein
MATPVLDGTWQHSLCPGGQVCGGHGHRGGRRHGHPPDLGSQEEEPGKPEEQVKQSRIFIYHV